ncbi:hypothetical protein J2X31_003211 [Flavobacterium arsenatis]|uniref:Uncharacterized protein n=1 Tax=Flavobacterium arsenatis TaxID=1484332 RepID=A0ABU1TTG3_9FLAO|nr:hypothetical protein [Flavobacterium arsenatis]MDR6969184.1 hypothetical protein [Flavobacterium arsenatis]
MNTEIKNTLFRFVSMRAPELSNDTEQNLRFVFRPDLLVSKFKGVEDSPEKKEKLKEAIDTALTYLPISSLDRFVPATKETLRTEFDNTIYLFSIWLAKNKIGYRKTELAEKIIPALSVVKPNGERVDFSDKKNILWDNIFYQVVTHKDFYAKELAMQLLHALHVIENYEEGNHAKNALLMKARVVLPKEFFVDEVAEETNTIFSTLSTEPRIALLPNRIMQKRHVIAYTEDENEKLEKLKGELKKGHKEYQKEYSQALKEAQVAHQILIKPTLEAHKLAVKTSLQNWCSIRNPELEYNPKDPCSTPPVIPEPDLEPFEFTFRKEVDLDYFRDNEILSEESLQLLETLTNQSNLQARGPIVAGLNFEKKSVLEDTDSFDKTFAGIDSLIANNRNLIIENTEIASNKRISLGGVLIPISNNNTIVNPFEYELSANTLINGEQKAMLSFEVPDSSWEIESFSYTFDKGSEIFTNVISQSNRIGNHIILSSLPLGNVKVNEEITGAFNGEIRFLNGGKKDIVIGNLNLSNILIGQLFNPVETDVDGNEGFVPAGFGMKQLGIADYKRVEQSVHCYVEGEVAHIENIMAREYKEKSTRRLRKSENTTTSSSESEREQLTDTTSTERYDMQSEVAKVIQQSNDFLAGTQFSVHGAGYSLGGSANFATHNSKEESSRQSVTQAKEITEKALDRIVNKVKEERIEKIVEEYEENNKHGFDNTQGDKHVVGVYRWVDKLYKNKVINYGKRLMFEFMIPQPGKLHTLGMKEGLDNESTEFEAPQDPRTFQKDLISLTSGLNLKRSNLFTGSSLNLKDYSKVNDTTLKYWSSKYNVEVPSKPEQEITIGKGFAYTAPETMNSEWEETAAGSEEVQIPDGYVTESASVSWHHSVEDNCGSSVIVGKNKYSVNPNGAISSPEEEFVKGYIGSIPVSYSALGHHSGNVNVEIKCKLTTTAEQKWQQETFKAIIDAYEDSLAIYKEKLEAEKQKAITIKGTNPGFYRQIENTILRKNCISYMIDRRKGAKKTYGLEMSNRKPFIDYEINLNEGLDNYAAFVKFMEQAFEWDLMSYNLYPFYWGSKSDWASLYQYDESNDPLFRNFMQSGMARVIATVRPGFEDAVRYFLQTGKIWSGGEVPLIHDELYMSIVEELDDQEGKQEGKAWITRLPTALTILQADSIGLKVEKALPCNCDDIINDETFENPEEALCSSKIESEVGQTLAGATSAKAQNNITRVLRVAYDSTLEGTVISRVLNAINIGVPYPVRFTVLEDEDYIIAATPQFSPSVEGYVTPIFKYKLVNLGKNKTGEHYGFEGIQLTPDNLELIHSNEAAVKDYLNNPGTQLVDLGWDITGTTISTFINNLENPIDLQEQGDGYVIVKVTDNDDPKTYFFTGQGGSYGMYNMHAQEAFFVLLNQTHRTNEETFVFAGNQKFSLVKTAKNVLMVTVNGQKLNKIGSNVQYSITTDNELEIVDNLTAGDVINIIYYYS